MHMILEPQFKNLPETKKKILFFLNENKIPIISKNFINCYDLKNNFKVQI